MFTKFSNPEWFMENTTPPPPSPAPKPSGQGNSGINKPAAPTPSAPKQGACKGASCGQCKTSMVSEIAKIPRDRFNTIVIEYMDISHIPTITQVMSLNEAEQNAFLVSLTNRLYQMLVGKVSEVDYGDIPSTKGYIQRLPKYKQMRECIEILHDIFTQYKEDTTPVDEIDNALSNLENNTDLFAASYAGGIELGIITYETAALGVVTSLGFMIAVCIEYVKDPKKQGLQIVLKKTGIGKVKDHLIYENLIRFNEVCRNGELEKGLRPLIKNNIKSLAIEGITLFHSAIALGVIVAALIPFLKQMVYFFYSSRLRVSTYLDAQADLLEMNAAELKSNNLINTESNKQQVIARQLKIAELFHRTADQIAFDSKESEMKATKAIKADKQSIKMDQVESNPATMTTSGNEPLF